MSMYDTLADRRPDLVNKFSPDAINAMKDTAYKRREYTGRKLHQELRTIAQQHGYDKWEQLVMMNRNYEPEEVDIE